MSQEEVDRAAFWTEANRRVRKSGKDNFKGERIQVTNNFGFKYLEQQLEQYEDKLIIQLLKFGFPLNAENTELQNKIPANQEGARINIEELRGYVKNQRAAGTIIGPFRRNPFGRYARFSPLDTRPKKDSTEQRIIMNLSHPHKGGSVNESINKAFFNGQLINLRYPTTDDLAKIIISKGRNCKIFKRDLHKAYKQFFNCPGCIHLLGFVVDDYMYFDLTLCMGAASSAYFCQRVTNCITYIFSQQGYQNVNYLDDLGGAEEADEAEKAFQALGTILQNSHITESSSKAAPPNEIETFLGILFNTKEMSLRITGERLEEIRHILSEWGDKEMATLKELQSLLGKLNFAASTIRAGRIFVSRIITEITNRRDNSKQNLPDFIKKDIAWWKRFMEPFDGVFLIPDYSWQAPGRVFTTDACLTGCGGWTADQCFHARFPDWLLEDRRVSINELETMAIVIGVKIWGDKIKNRNILVHCDNKPTVNIINKGRASNEFAQQCLRELCFVTANHNTVIKVVFKPGITNSKADWLSRYHLSNWYREAAEKEIRNNKWDRVLISEQLFKFSHNW